MATTINCVIGMASIMVYLFCSIMAFGVPPSISDTFYLWEKAKKGYGMLFTLALASVTFLVTPYWLSITPDKWRFLAFIAGAALTFVGVASNFLNKDEKPIHYGAAFTWAGCSLVWVVVVGKWFLILPSVLLFCGVSWLVSARQNTTFWGEVTVVIALLLSLAASMIL